MMNTAHKRSDRSDYVTSSRMTLLQQLYVKMETLGFYSNSYITLLWICLRYDDDLEDGIVFKIQNLTYSAPQSLGKPLVKGNFHFITCMYVPTSNLSI